MEMKKMSFQNSMSPSMKNMNNMMDMMNMLTMMVMSFIMYMMVNMMMNKMINKSTKENNKIELMWTILPMMILIKMAQISIKTIYMNNETKLNIITIKTMSNQWFWYYEYLNFNIKFNSFIQMKNNFNFFNLENDNNLIIPFNYQIQMIISSMDVIHSWSIPSMNIKLDSIPNYINQSSMIINKPSMLFGQCSEICGMNHSMMPISIESINMKNFIKWIKNF